MANITKDRVAHATSGTSTVDTITLNPRFASVQIVNVTGASAIYVQNLPEGAPADPTVKGDNCVVIPAAVGAFATVKTGDAGDVAKTGGASTVIKIISAAPTDYSVQGEDL